MVRWILVLSLLAPAMAMAKGDPLRDGRGLRYVWTEPEGSWDRVTLLPDDDDQGVTLIWETSGVTSRRHFGAVILQELRKRWGSRRFDISRWKSELGCRQMVRWDVEAGGQRRTICRQKRPIDRIADLGSAIQLMMSVPEPSR